MWLKLEEYLKCCVWYYKPMGYMSYVNSFKCINQLNDYIQNLIQIVPICSELLLYSDVYLIKNV